MPCVRAVLAASIFFLAEMRVKSPWLPKMFVTGTALNDETVGLTGCCDVALLVAEAKNWDFELDNDLGLSTTRFVELGWGLVGVIVGVEDRFRGGSWKEATSATRSECIDERTGVVVAEDDFDDRESSDEERTGGPISLIRLRAKSEF